MNSEPDEKLYGLRLLSTEAELPLKPSTLGNEPREGLVWFEPAPGTRTAEHEEGFHPLLRKANDSFPNIELLELRHFRPDGVTHWQTGQDQVRCCIVDEIEAGKKNNDIHCYSGVHRIEKKVLPNPFTRFPGKLDFNKTTPLTLFEYWLQGRLIAWRITPHEDQ